MTAKVLIVDDDEAMRAVLEERLSQWGYRPIVAASVDEAEALAAEESPDLVVSDVVLGERDGLELLRHLQAGDAPPPMLLITAHATVDLSVEAMKHGAEDFLTKPLDYAKLRATLDSIAGDLRASREQRQLGRAAVSGDAHYGRLVGSHESMREIYDQIEMVAETDASVLILGESGTGKEVTARTIHERSARRGAAFVAINAAAIPSELMESEVFGHEKGAFTGATSAREGCFELAEGGTLFLDEIGEMSMELQPKLLRVLEDGRIRRLGGKSEREVDVRLLAATNQVPEVAVAEGRLRADLYYRLNVFTIELPPLRHRRSDVALLATTFLSELAEKHRSEIRGFRDEAMELLEGYDWPGNVRELRKRGGARSDRGARRLGRAGSPAGLPPRLRPTGRGRRGGAAGRDHRRRSRASTHPQHPREDRQQQVGGRAAARHRRQDRARQAQVLRSRDVTLRNRLLASFLTVAATLVGVVAYQLILVERLKEAHLTLAEGSTKSIGITLELLQELDAVADLSRRYLVLRDQAYAERVIRLTRTLDASLARLAEAADADLWSADAAREDFERIRGLAGSDLADSELVAGRIERGGPSRRFESARPARRSAAGDARPDRGAHRAQPPSSRGRAPGGLAECWSRRSPRHRSGSVARALRERSARAAGGRHPPDRRRQLLASHPRRRGRSRAPAARGGLRPHGLQARRARPAQERLRDLGVARPEDPARLDAGHAAAGPRRVAR